MSPKETNPQPAPVPQQQEAGQTITVPQGQQVQYVVSKQSLEGLDGWLTGWLLYLGLWAIGGISSFFGLLESGGSSSRSYRSSAAESADNVRTVSLLFLPVIVVIAITAIVFIAQRKKVGVQASLALIAATGAYGLVTTLVGSSGAAAAAVAGGVCTTVLVCVLQALYFFQSKRVKATLTK